MGLVGSGLAGLATECRHYEAGDGDRLASHGLPQFVAYQFRYQAALGAPLLVQSGHAVYQPTAWAFWLFQHSNTTSLQVKQPLLAGALIVAIGSAATVLVVYGLNLRRARRLSANTEDLHGSLGECGRYPGDRLSRVLGMFSSLEVKVFRPT